ncbi:TonB-dependent receptor [Thalassotalea sp. ND16A]|uniref:TonB-dependent receptor n=1 Tax=Thalassotalea sp. ND16A TaxID=1535422 RepID=UPI00051D37C4|nr:TonB-dependent receptor [Thalassotalea sp. ND16A]KGJ92116.1 hypothetical protein ND16A_1752 [Thalassotalea sp. ND16A]
MQNISNDNANLMFRKNKLASAIFAVLAPITISGAAVAEESVDKKKADDTEVIVVTGIRGSLVSSLQNKRFEGSVVDGIAAEDIGKFPDQNVAESLQRITGVTIDRDSGEGRSISIRGFGPEFNSVMLNNRTVPTDSGGRAFSFDLLASELISGADVYKTSRSSMAEGSIGGLVNIKTAKPLEIEGFRAVGSTKAIYDTLAETTNPSVSGLISQNFDDDFGILAAFSYQSREGRTDAANVSRYREDFVIPGSDPKGPTTTEKAWRPQSADQTYKVQERDRIGASLVGQWAVSDNLLITTDVIYSKLTVDDSTSSLSRWFSNPNFNSVIDENNTVQSLSRVPKPLVSQGVYQLWENGERLGTGQWNSANQGINGRDVTTTMVGINANWEVSDNFTVDFDLQTSGAKARSGDNFGGTLANPTQNVTNFALSGDAFSWDGPAIDFTGTPDSYYANTVSFNQTNRDDDITELHIDTEWTLDDMGVLAAIKSGVYYSDREKINERKETNWGTVISNYRGFHYNAPASMMNTVSPSGGILGGNAGLVNSWYDYNPQDLVDFFLGDEIFDQLPSFGNQIINNFENGDPTHATRADAEAAAAIAVENAREKLIAAQAYMPEGANGSPLGAFAPEHNAGKSWKVTEETTAAYIEAILEGEGWSGNIGLRYISTDTASYGNGNDLVGFNIDSAQGAGILDVASGQDISASSSYSKLLPSMNLKFDLADDVVARVAYSETMTRPQLSQLTPTQNYSGTGIYDANNELQFDGTIVGQNVNLNPYTSVNFDLAVEWYYSDDSYIGATYFNKEIKDWITTQTRQVTLEVPTYIDDVPSDAMMLDFDNTAPYNSDSADASGLEFALMHNFDNGFGVQFNYTYMDSSAAFTPGQENLSFALAGLSKDSYNLITYYENGPLQARIAYNWRGEYVKCTTCKNGQPEQSEDYGQFDASVSYDLNDNFSIFAEGINITDEDTRTYSTYTSRFLSKTATGARFTVGVRASF